MRTPSVSSLGAATATGEPRDLRVVPLAAAAWAAAWLGTGGTAWAWLPAVAGVVVIVVAGLPTRSRGQMWSRVAVGLVLAGVTATATAGAHRLTTGPVAALAADRASVGVVLVPRTDLQVRAGTGPRGSYGTTRAVAVELHSRGGTQRLRVPVLMVVTGAALPGWSAVRVGSRVLVRGQLVTPDPGADVAAILRVRAPPELVGRPSATLRVVERVRQGLRDAVASRRPDPRALVPALVVGDTSAMTTGLNEDFRETGLTHLTAVSGANLTLLLAFLLTAGRWCGIRGWWLRAIGPVAVLIFILLCRSEPSVLRAAAMGVVSLAALGSGARRAGLRNLAVAALALLIVDPFLSRSVGFALSVLASGGIVWWARGWTEALQRWAPRMVAEAVAIPVAAQLATQPVVTAIAGRISLSGLLANALAGPWVGPATVLGFAAAGVSLLSGTAAAVIAFGAAWSAQAIIWIARVGAQLPGTSWSWPTSVPALVWLGVGCLTLAQLMSGLLARWWCCLAVSMLLTLGLGVAPRPPGWPPRDWSLVGCDVGQGDGLVVRTARHEAVVVDTGPDPRAMDRCLDQLGVRSVPLLVLSHFHADHVDGLPGLGRRPVGEVWVGPLAEPAYEVVRIDAWARTRGARVVTPAPGLVAAIGSTEIRVLGPVPHPVEGDASSVQNDQSLVVAINTGGLRVLLAGDVEPAGQRAILRTGADLRADVLKIPHHGSSRQDPEFFAATGARVALVSAGVDNDYGHPAPRTVQLVAGLGMTLLRTDQQGSVAVGRDGAGRLVATAQRQP